MSVRRRRRGTELTMAIFKALADKLEKKKAELQRKAAEKAAEMAIERGKQAALGAAANARKKIEEALFGDEKEEKEEPKPASVKAKPQPKGHAPRKDPAEERAKLAEQKAKSAAQLERDVDDDLAALKARIAKGKTPTR